MKSFNESKVRGWALRLAAVLLTGCATSGGVPEARSTQDTARDTAVSVSLFLFSGRPDPEFQITDQKQLERLRAQLSSAPKHDEFAGEHVVPSRLGYRGIQVENAGGIEGMPRTFQIYDGAIELVVEQRSTFLRDRDRRLERELVDSALKHGAIDAKLHAKILASW